MTLYRLFRWVLFFLVGIPVQLFVYCIYPFASAYFLLFVAGRHGKPLWSDKTVKTLDYLISRAGTEPLRDSVFINNQDDHNALTHLYLWRSTGNSIHGDYIYYNRACATANMGKRALARHPSASRPGTARAIRAALTEQQSKQLDEPTTYPCCCGGPHAPAPRCGKPTRPPG